MAVAGAERYVATLPSALARGTLLPSGPIHAQGRFRLKRSWRKTSRGRTASC